MTKLDDIKARLSEIDASLSKVQELVAELKGKPKDPPRSHIVFYDPESAADSHRGRNIYSDMMLSAELLALYGFGREHPITLEHDLAHILVALGQLVDRDADPIEAWGRLHTLLLKWGSKSTAKPGHCDTLFDQKRAISILKRGRNWHNLDPAAQTYVLWMLELLHDLFYRVGDAGLLWQLRQICVNAKRRHERKLEATGSAL